MDCQLPNSLESLGNEIGIESEIVYFWASCEIPKITKQTNQQTINFISLLCGMRGEDHFVIQVSLEAKGEVYVFNLFLGGRGGCTFLLINRGDFT